MFHFHLMLKRIIFGGGCTELTILNLKYSLKYLNGLYIFLTFDRGGVVFLSGIKSLFPFFRLGIRVMGHQNMKG